MAKLVWDQDGQRVYETGVKKCALYVKGSNGYNTGVAWNGITAINESPSGAEASDIYANDKKYLSLYSAEELGATIEAYTYPDAFMQCDGSAMVNGVKLNQQSRSMFALAFVTTIGNDDKGIDFGEKLHVIYGCRASVSARDHATINESPEAQTFSWEITTTKQPVSFTYGGNTYKDVCSVEVVHYTDPTYAAAHGGCSDTAWNAVNDALFGTVSTDATLKTPDEIFALVMPSAKHVTYELTKATALDPIYVVGSSNQTVTFVADNGYTFAASSVTITPSAAGTVSLTAGAIAARVTINSTAAQDVKITATATNAG